MNKDLKTKDIVLTGLGIALVFVTTLFIKIPNAIDGYFNLGDGFILLFASILDPFLAFLVGGLGSAFADVAGGYAYYFIPTLIIKGTEAIVVAYLMSKFGKKIQKFAYILGAIIMVTGYFIAKWYLKGSIAIALTGIPENIFQSGVGVVIAYVCYPLVNKCYKKVYQHELQHSH
jgi:uncharacterized membrane protein